MKQCADYTQQWNHSVTITTLIEDKITKRRVHDIISLIAIASGLFEVQTSMYFIWHGFDTRKTTNMATVPYFRVMSCKYIIEKSLK
jgi:hypothetical protein